MGDYINCPLDEAQYNALVDELLAGEKSEFRDWEKDTPYFDGCLPVEVMAERGRETLRFGPLKPVGLTNAHRPDDRPYAVVQLRQDNALGTLWNMVGFQTKLKHSEQKRVFRLIPGLEKARFARLGGIHRNSFLNSPELLDADLSLKGHENIFFAGQIIGVEGYVESASMGLLAGIVLAAKWHGREYAPPPAATAHGALLAHVTGGHIGGKKGFQPMNVNFGLMPPPNVPAYGSDGRKLKRRERKMARKESYCRRALDEFASWLADRLSPDD
jgi:methylenetetrahydrofolate--tRNA-(uracil-5-)-methyltransferase